MDSPTTFETFAFSGKSVNCYGLEVVSQNLRRRGFNIMHKPGLTGNWTITKRMLAIRGGDAVKKLMYNVALHEGKMKRAQRMILDEYKAAYGVDLIGEWPDKNPMPWDGFVKYERDKMLKISRAARIKAAA
jgi:hypothetical protein